MSASGQEIEVKFYVRDLAGIQMRLQELSASTVQARVLETNVRFDLPGTPLRAQGRVLRLRQDTEARFTYKGASQNEGGVVSREEIEFTVGDFDKAKRFLEALGYERLVYYEKYRTTYELDHTLVMLDELPYGNFVEIEGEDVESIRLIASQLRLDWESAVATGYHALFERARKGLSRNVKDLSFAEFEGLHIEPAHLGVTPADL